MTSRSVSLAFCILAAVAAAAWVVNVQRQPATDRRTRLRLMPRTLVAGGE